MLRRFGVVAVLACVAAGCSNPPTKEHDQAVAALAAARAADAVTYAPDEFQAAQTALSKYDDAVQQRDYRQALSDAIDARDHAFEAARLASLQKAAARTALQGLVTNVDAELKAASTRLTPPARLAPPAADHLRNAMHAAAPALQEARTALAAERYHDGFARLQGPADDLKKALGASDPARRGRDPH